MPAVAVVAAAVDVVAPVATVVAAAAFLPFLPLARKTRSRSRPLSLLLLVQCQPDGFLLLVQCQADGFLLPKSCCSVVQCQPDGFLLPKSCCSVCCPWPRLTSRLAVVVVVHLVPRSCSLLPFQASFSLVPIQASTGSFEQGLVVRQFVPQCRTGTDIRRNVTRASES